MAVPGFEKKTRLCERCFANVPSDLATCPECGAEMHSDNAIEGSDAAVYPELSRANLLRMRGDYRGAEEQCLTILKRYPNNATVHTLLGDIYAEQDDLEQAVQWYELALDLKPDSATDHQKLAAIHERQRVRESANSIESLGLPNDRPNIPLFAILSLGAIVLVGFIAYLLGQGVQAKRQDKIIAPVNAPGLVSDVDIPPSIPETPNRSTPFQRTPQVDRELSAMVQQRSPASGNLLSILVDPRSHIAVVTYSVGSGEDPKRIGAELARTVLEQGQDTLIVTLRGVRDDKIAYMADVPRSRYSELQSGSYNNGDAWVDHLVTNEWPPPETPATPPVDSAAPSGTTGGTAPQQFNEPETGGPTFTPPVVSGK